VAVAGLVGCASAPPASEPLVLRVLLADDWASAPAVGEVVDEFERANPGVRVQIQGSPFSQIPEVVASAIDLGQPHDVAHWHAFAAASAGIAEPLDDLWEEAGLDPDAYLPGALEDVSWPSEERYGVPLDTNALVLMANEQHLRQAGVAPEALATLGAFPASTAELMAGRDAEHAISISSSSWAAYGWIVASGGSLVEIDEMGEPTFTFEDPGTLRALELMVGLVRDGRSPSPFAQDLSLDAVAAFATGDVALHASGSWDLPITRRALQSEYQVEEIAVLPLPQVSTTPRTVLGGSSLFVPTGAPERELAFELMLALTEDDVALRLAQEEGRLPAKTRVLEHELFASTPDLAAFVEQLEYAEVMPLIAYPEVAGAFRDSLEDVLRQRVTPEEAMREVQAFADDWLVDR
jgi:ABC-type glycerol-3-phosphate transport system substrate-binding protein